MGWLLDSTLNQLSAPQGRGHTMTRSTCELHELGFETASKHTAVSTKDFSRYTSHQIGPGAFLPLFHPEHSSAWQEGSLNPLSWSCRGFLQQFQPWSHRDLISTKAIWVIRELYFPPVKQVLNLFLISQLHLHLLHLMYFQVSSRIALTISILLV